MKLTRQRLKQLIEAQISEMQTIPVIEEEELAPPTVGTATTNTPEQDPKLTYTGMKLFAQKLLDGEAIPAPAVAGAKKEMGKNPSAATMAQFITIILKAFGVDQSEIATVAHKVKSNLPK